MIWSKQERVAAAFNHEMADRVPIFECLLHDGALEHFGGKKIEPGDAEGLVRAYSKCLDVSHPLWVPEENRIESDEQCFNRLKNSRSIIYGKFGFFPGIVRTYEKWTNWSSSDPFKSDELTVEWVKGQIEAEKSWNADTFFLENFENRLRGIRDWKGDMVYPEIYTMDPFYRNYMTLGIERFTYLYYDYPELVKEWLDATLDRMLRKIEIKIKYCRSPTAMVWSDLAAKGGLLFSPDTLNELCFPYLEQIIHLLHSYDIKVIFHSDGDIYKILPTLVDHCKIDGYNTLEVKAGVNVRQIKEEFGKRLTLVGGMNSDILAMGSAKEVVHETRVLLDYA
ncbi:hypothetical protein MASR2M78_17150 [Treponema sp.]